MGLTFDTLDGLLSHCAAGLRMALTLLALMLLLNRPRDLSPFTGPSWYRRVKSANRLHHLAWVLIGFAAIAFSPLRSADLLGARTSTQLALLGDIVASGLACASFIIRIAARGIVYGLSGKRVRRGVLTNVAIVALIVATTWFRR